MPRAELPPIALAVPRSHQGPGPSSLGLQFQGPKKNAAAPGITNPLKTGKSRSEYPSSLPAFPPLIQKRNPSLLPPTHPSYFSSTRTMPTPKPFTGKEQGSHRGGVPITALPSGVPVFTHDQQINWHRC